MLRVVSMVVLIVSMTFGYQYHKEQYVRSNTTSACPLYNMYVFESWECGEAFDSDSNLRERYCGEVKVFRYTKGDKATGCYYEGYVGTFTFKNVAQKEMIINKYKNKMW